MDFNRFWTFSLRQSPEGEKITRVLSAGIEAVDPGNSVRKFIFRDKNQLTIGTKLLKLSDFEKIIVIGFGKASIPMTAATIDVLGEKLTRGLIITKSIDLPTPYRLNDSSNQWQKIVTFEGSHPVPEIQNLVASNKIIELLLTTTPKDLVIFLISGGGSALLTSPVEGITLNDIQQLTHLLLASGADIVEINCLRKHLSRVKGGRLAQLTYPARTFSLILSDVVNDPLDSIASGPTVPDPTTFSHALSILDEYKLKARCPTSITHHLQNGVKKEIPETPKSSNPVFNRVTNIIVGNNVMAAEAAKKQASIEGFNASIISTSLQGEAREAGRMMAAISQQIKFSEGRYSHPSCFIAGGETTVTIQGSGIGGRNLELALASVDILSGVEDIVLVTLATDGQDGPTDAAGAVVTGFTKRRGLSYGLEPGDYLYRNDSYNYFEPLSDLCKPGITHTNVCDLTFIFTC